MILSLVLLGGLILICATVAQLILLNKIIKPQRGRNYSRYPGISFHFHGADGNTTPPISPAIFAVFSAASLGSAQFIDFFLAIAIQWTGLFLLNVKLHKNLLKAGESQSKALLTNR